MSQPREKADKSPLRRVSSSSSKTPSNTPFERAPMVGIRALNRVGTRSIRLLSTDSSSTIRTIPLPSAAFKSKYFNSRSLILVSSIVTVSTLYSIQSREPLRNDSAQILEQSIVQDPVIAYKSNDPLSVLSPEALLAVRTHLDDISTIGLLKCWIVYAASSQSKLVEAGPWMLKQLEDLRATVPYIGSGVWRLFTICMKSTFYDTFVGGNTVPDCADLVNAYAAKDIGVLLNYSAEASNDGSANATGVNTKHIDEAVNALIACAKFETETGVKVDAGPTIKPTLLAIKLTGLIFEPALLSRATTALVNSSSFLRGTESSALFPEAPELSEEDHIELAKLHKGLKAICGQAKAGGVRILIDAEQSWYQPAIDRFVDLLSEEFNKPFAACPDAPTIPSIPIVHNTYQCYTRAAEPSMLAALVRSEQLGYSFGAKLVRGAYVESERKRWELAGSNGECTIWDTKQQTDDAYDQCAEILEKRIIGELKNGKGGQRGTAVFVASHNGTSVKKLLHGLREDGLAKNTDDGLEIDERVRGRMSFAQLMGMSDNLTNTLVQLIAKPKADSPSVPFVIKAVPYANVDQALPYLIRRANENQSILKSDPTSGRGGAQGERKAVGKEFRRRMGIPF